MARKKQSEPASAQTVPVVPDPAPAPPAPVPVAPTLAPADASAQVNFADREVKLPDAPAALDQAPYLDALAKGWAAALPSDPVVAPEAPVHPAYLASATALLDVVDNTSASTATRLDAAEALLEHADRLTEEYSKRSIEFLFRVVDRKRPDAINGEPRDRVRAARMILKYGRPTALPVAGGPDVGQRPRA